MRLASASGISLAALVLTCLAQAGVGAPARSPETAGEPRIANGAADPPPAVDLSREQQLVEEARAASKANDVARARATAGEAIGLLLARPESERDAGWLQVLDSAGLLALEALDLPTARAALEEVLGVRSRTLPDDHPDLQTARQNFARTLDDLPAARALQEKVLEVRTRTLPEDHDDVQLARSYLALTFRAQSDPAAARALYEKVLEARLRTLPEDHTNVLLTRGSLAVTLRTLGNLAGARELQEMVLAAFERTVPEDDFDRLAAQASLALTLRVMNDVAGAVVLEEKVLEIRTRTLPDEHPLIQEARSNLAVTLRRLARHAEALPIQEKCYEILLRTLPDDHPTLQSCRQSLAFTLYRLGRLSEARALEEKVLEVRTRTLPDDHIDLQAARTNLAATLTELGDIARARKLFEQSLEAYTRTLPDDHRDLQRARGNYATILYKLGDAAGALALREKVLEVLSRTLPEDDPALQSARGAYSVSLRTLGDFAGARALQEKVLQAYSRTMPEEHPDFQKMRDALSSTLLDLKDLAGARVLIEKILEIDTRTLPEGHPDILGVMQNLSLVLRRLGDVAAARALIEEAFEITSRTLPDDHPDRQTMRANLLFTLAASQGLGTSGGAESQEKEKDKAEFVRVAADYARTMARSTRSIVLEVSSREAEERCANSIEDVGRALSFAEGMGAFGRDAGLERGAFVLSEETRGAALASARFSRSASADPRYEDMRESLRTASDELTRLARRGAGADELDRARQAREAAERGLAGLARGLSDGGKSPVEIDPDALSASLSEREALIGYRRAPRWTFVPDEGVHTARGSERMCAFVVRSGGRLTLVDLGLIEPIERAVGGLRQSIGVGSGRGLAAGPASPAIEDDVVIQGEIVRQLIFDPLLPALEGVDRIVVALDDVLNLVPLEALPLERDSRANGSTESLLLGDQWRFETRCTLSELSWEEESTQPSAALVAIGGAAFDLAPLSPSEEESETEEETRAAAAPVVSGLLRGGAWEAGFTPLAQTGAEASGISILHREAFGDAASAFVLEKRKASRASLVELAPRARFLHIATHGWFATESVRSIADPEPLDKLAGVGSRMSAVERAKGMSPMLLCGLALAGANLPDDAVGRAAGLITADEISTLDLAGCELAVLSACDTNVGERRAGQGVASLQKALHMAGARTVITSLWKVPDEATRELMLDFYRRIWIEKKPKGVALWEAKKKIRNAVDERGRPLYSTRDWAAWVLTGEPN